MNTLKFIQLLLLSLTTVSSVSLLGCSPKFYLIDRQTILEEEAAGEWPEFEKDLLEKSKSQGPEPFVKTDSGTKRSRLYNVLNGELTSQAQANSTVK